MIRFYKKILLVVYCILEHNLSAQSDTTLPMEQYLRWVISEHPDAKQAQWRLKQADAEILKAKGYFDPKFYTELNSKTYQGKEYYNTTSSELKIPTAYGFSLYANYDRSRGAYINPESTLPENGLWGAGVELNILQGLLFDDIRANIRQAKLSEKMAQNHRDIIINDLLLSASSTYFNWHALSQSKKWIEKSIQNMESYLTASSSAYQLGDKPAVDTLEAFMYLQERKIALQDNEALHAEFIQLLSGFIWNNGSPVLLRSSVKPSFSLPLHSSFDENNIENYLNHHPLINEKTLEISKLNIDKKLAKEKFKPTLTVKYSLLNGFQESVPETNFTTNQNKWAVRFSLPILYRKERGELKKIQYKIEEYNWQQSEKRNEIRLKLVASIQKMKWYEKQLQVQKIAIGSSEKLLQAEKTKFDMGESSIFLLNAREMKYLESQLKGIQIELKYQTAYINCLYWSNEIKNWGEKLAFGHID